MPAIELPPFTAAHREAVKSCRFYTPNVEHSMAWAWTDDVEVVRVLCLGAGMTAAERATAGADEHPRVADATYVRRCSDPELYEWELHITHPDGVAFVCDQTATSQEGGE